jgi:hypothetical protein
MKNMNLCRRKLISITRAIIISIAAPLVVTWIGWMLSLGYLLIFPHGLIQEVFLPIAATLCFSVTPVFIFILLKTKVDSYIFPIAGAVAPLPVAFVILFAFGTLADDVEMAMRLVTFFTLVITGFISGIAALLLNYIWNATAEQLARDGQSPLIH